MKKRILSLLLSLAMVLTLFSGLSLPASAEDCSGSCGADGDNLTWTFDPDTGLLTIEGSGAMENYSSSTAPWYSYRGDITAVSLPDGLSNIGNYAFKSCSRLINATIPDSVTAIGSDAFNDCSALTNMVIPDNVTAIFMNAFYGCVSLTSVTIPGSVSVIGESAFSNCSALESVVLGNGIIKIEGSAFLNCGSLSSITIPSSTSIINSKALGWCYDGGYKAVDGFTIYGYDNTAAQSYAETEGFSFVSLGAPNVVRSCGKNLTWEFDESSGLLTIEGSGEMYDWTCCLQNSWLGMELCSAPWQLENLPITAVSLPEGLTSIGSYAFYSCSSLGNVTIPNSVTSIGDSAFSSCSSLANVTIPDRVTSIGSYAFAYCGALSEVALSASVNSIERAAFFHCSALTSVTIPASVTSIGKKAFGYSYNSYYTVTPVAGFTIRGYNNTAARTYARENGFTFVSLGDYAEPCGDNLTWTYNSSGRQLIIQGSGAMYDWTIDWSTIEWNGYYDPDACNAPWSLDCMDMVSVSLPNGLTHIGDCAFFRCFELDYVEIPNSVTSIGDCAFLGGSRLKSIIIPAGVTSIGEYAFGYDVHGAKTEGFIIYGYPGTAAESYARANGFTFVPFDRPAGLCGAEGDGSNLVWSFDADTGLLTIEGSGAMAEYSGMALYSGFNPFEVSSVYPDAPWAYGMYDGWLSVTGVSLPEGLTNIGSFAFCESPLTSVTIPGSVSSIGEFAFFYSLSLSHVTIPEGSLQSIGEGAFYGCPLSYVTIPACVTSIADRAFEKTADFTIYGYEGTAAETYANEHEIPFIPLDNLGGGGNGDELSGFCGVANEGRNLSWSYNPGTYQLTVTGSGAMKEFNNGEVPWKAYQSEIKRIELPEGLTDIGSAAFSSFRKLPTVTIPESVTKIGEAAFSDDLALSSVFIGESLREIGGAAFYNCPRLRYVLLPASVTGIGEKAFGWYPDPDSGTDVRVNGFTIYGFPDTVVQSYAEENGFIFIPIDLPGGSCGAEGDNLSWSYNPGSHRLIISGSGAMADFEENEAPWTGFQHDVTAVELPDGLTSIGSAAFYGCGSLSGVTIPDSVRSIGESAFGFCVSLTSVTIPEGVTSINDKVFLDCSALTGVKIPESVTEIKTAAFFGCTGLTDVRIPENVTRIGTDAFMHCTSLMSITIPAGTSSIGSKAFGWFANTSNSGIYRIADFTIYGWTGTAAQTYADTDGFTFIPLDGAVGGFLDVSADDYYAAPVLWAVEKGITAGTGEHTFSPEKACTRAQIMTFLWSAAGRPEPTGSSSPFEDVPENAYYYKAVLWAVQNGITSGTSATTFSPTAVCNRAQAVTFLWRAAGQPKAGITNPFRDVSAASWYYEAVLWAVENEITAGTSATTFSPRTECTRGQIVTFLYADLAEAE